MKVIFIGALLSMASSLVAAKGYLPPTYAAECGKPSHFVQSCTAKANDTSINSCCVEKTAGQFVLAQLWDTNAGYENKFTIHGLWSDYCTKGWPQFCDPSRERTNITDILVSRGAFKLMHDMNNMWPNSQGNVDNFWSHEWNKHGTCMDTFKPSCYKNKDPIEGMINFFNATVQIYEKYDLYKVLKRHGVVPGRKYNTKKVQEIIKHEFGMMPDLQCKNDKLTEAWMYLYFKGPITMQQIVPQPYNNNATNCNSTFIYPAKYPFNATAVQPW
ncbi:ribonuclease T2-like protein [Gongronella butleri]|nr:ribonuclease T2-like protein [Gongronella butleri]